jgi:hypothetical protein
MACPPCRSQYRSFLSVADVLPAAPLAAALVSFSCQRFARRAVRCIARFFFLSTSCPQRRSLHHSFLCLDNGLPAAPLAVPLVSFSCQGFARRAVLCIGRSFFSSTSCLLHRSLLGSFLPLVDVFVTARLAASLGGSLYRSFPSLAEVLRAVPLATLLVSISFRRLCDVVQYWILYRKIMLVKTEYSNTQ